MTQDERFYAFVVARTSRSRAQIRRITIRLRWLAVSACVLVAVFCTAVYGFYSFAQRFTGRGLEHENSRLRMVNEIQQQQLDNLKNRVEAVEDASRRISKLSGVSRQREGVVARGAGGPLLSLDAATISAIEYRAAHLERELQAFETVMRERAKIPSLWPVEGAISDGFGTRRNPFGDGAAEFHAGQDITAPWGTQVIATGGGGVIFAGTQNGYGQIVILDHGNGLTTRYGHLSKIDVAIGQEVKRGVVVGRVGSTGRSTGPHVHYEVRINETAVNPRRYLPDETACAAPVQ